MITIDQKMYEYYVMSIGEIMVLLFIFFLWVLSIYYCFKRYEKISTIERAEIRYEKPSRADSINSESKDSHVSTNYIKSSENSNMQTSLNNSATNIHRVNSTISTLGTILNDHSKLKKSNMSNYSLFTPNLNSGCTRMKSKAVSLEKESLYNSSLVYDRVSPLRQEVYCKDETYMKNKNHKYKYCAMPKKKASIRPKDDICLYFRPKPILTRSLSDPLFNLSSLHAPSNISVIIPHDIVVNRSQDKEHTPELLNPQLIPRIVRKSLMDLHKKSIYNLSHHHRYITLKNSKTGSGPLEKTGSGPLHSPTHIMLGKTSNKNSRTNVFTQQRNPNEIKMKIRDNYV